VDQASLCLKKLMGRRKGVKRYYNSQYKILLGGLFEHVPEICFNYQSIRISRVSAFRLKELNCMISANILFFWSTESNKILTSVIKCNKTKIFNIACNALHMFFLWQTVWAGALCTHTAIHWKATTSWFWKE